MEIMCAIVGILSIFFLVLACMAEVSRVRELNSSREYPQGRDISYLPTKEEQEQAIRDKKKRSQDDFNFELETLRSQVVREIKKGKTEVALSTYYSCAKQIQATLQQECNQRGLGVRIVVKTRRWTDGSW